MHLLGPFFGGETLIYFIVLSQTKTPFPSLFSGSSTMVAWGRRGKDDSKQNTLAPLVESENNYWMNVSQYLYEPIPKIVYYFLSRNTW